MGGVFAAETAEFGEGEFVWFVDSVFLHNVVLGFTDGTN